MSAKARRDIELRRAVKRSLSIALLCSAAACSEPAVTSPAATTPPVTTSAACPVEFMILGTSQDAGTPQIGNSNDSAWRNPKERRLAASAALIDHRSSKRYLFEATPDIREQLMMLDEASAPSNKANLGLSNIFMTHAHIGHYAGLMFLGRESAGTQDVNVTVMPRFAQYLKTNGPWEQLVNLKNIRLDAALSDKQVFALNDDLSITPYLVPHRDEYSETVGFVISGPSRKVLFLPDIDDWARWKTEHNMDIVDVVASVDAVFIDATFYDDNELPGRDMTSIPHPRVTDSMKRLKDHANKVHFIHINHTNPLRDFNSLESKKVRSNGFNVARRGQKICL